jgi:proline iminopeptidase
MEISIKTNDAELFTTVYANGGKETVLLLHGGPGVPEDLDPVAAFLAREFQVVYFHQRGTLRSPCASGNYDIDSYVADIDQVAAHFGLERFHLFGHSWGGLYAQLYGAQKKDRLLSLFLCSPAPGTGRQWAEMALEIRRFNKKRSSLREWVALNTNALLGLWGSERAYQRFYRQFGLNCNKGYRLDSPAPLLVDHLKPQPINRTNKAVLQHPALPNLPAPGYKITVTFGADDIYGDSTRFIRQRYVTARVITIPGSSHNPWLQNEKAFFPILAQHYGIAAGPAPAR